jgi:D-methionine transport system substrate-binding protein
VTSWQSQINFDWEVEGGSLDVLNWYRRQSTTSAPWRQLPTGCFSDQWPPEACSLRARLPRLAYVFFFLALLVVCTGCRRSKESKVLRIGVAPVPHGEILEQVIAPLEKRGVHVRTVSFDDYIEPNLALASGELDANFYQHVPFMQEFNRDHGTQFVAVTKVFIAPLAIYAGRTRSLASLPDNATIAIPNDPVNAGRALILLQAAGLLKVRTYAIDPPTLREITDNLKHIKIRELESAQVPRVLPDVDLAVINTNYALPAGLNPAKDSLFRETSESPYVNVLAVNAGRENDPAIRAVAEELNTAAIRRFIQQKYQGALVPAF